MTEAVQNATIAQIAAATPTTSTWVSANAGSGKTRVLTNRVARLLLTGSLPERILCLTFTKAAAAEMQVRLFSTLGEWAMLPEAELRRALEAIGERALTAQDLARARTLFAAALETPGGLKIQTIHAFCANLLRRFPLEAGVPPRFTEIDDRAAALLRAEILDAMAREDHAHLSAMAAHLSSDAKLDALLMGILANRTAFASATPQAVRQTFDIDGRSIDDANEQTLAQIDITGLKDIVHLMASQGGTNDQKYTKPLHDLFFGQSTDDLLPSIEAAVLTKGNPRSLKSYPTKALGPHQESIRETFAELQEIILNWRETLARIHMRDRTEALIPFAQEFIARYEAAKASSGLVDFDDLITLTGDLLGQPDVGPWVLYKLDGGIDHILVDEAQDTSPEQWRVIEALEAEFSSGETAIDRPRTLFVVGDKKQSIFSFQGADPEEFDHREQFFADRLAAVGRPFSGSELVTSFRSAGLILDLVDRTFSDDDDTNALGGAPKHVALPDRPGRIDLWPFVPAERESQNTVDGEDDPKGLDKIIDELNKPDPVRDLASDLAGQIGAMIGTEALPSPEGPRPVRAGDILVLVRSRSPFFHKLIDGLKSRGVPVAGADRLTIGEEIAVKDLMSTLKFLAATYDDLSLAEALRSPLFSFSEDELFGIAHDRGKQTLWQSLIASGAHPKTEARLRALLKRADFERPYEVLEHMLLDQGGRLRLTARLGAECEDAIDELLAEALNFERNSTPSLTGFIAWMEARSVEVKRNMEAGRNEVRVMTVHGAKGLEAPIVILPDVSKPDFSRSAEVVTLGDLPVWNVKKALKPRALQAFEDAQKEDERREHARLLYVALTRAESWLILCGAGGSGQPGADRWHTRASAAFDGLQSVPMRVADREILRAQSANWPPTPGDPPEAQSDAAELPAWVRQPASPAPQTPQPRTPSSLPGAHALPGEVAEEYSEDDAKARGRLIHDLLDRLMHLPAPMRAAAAAQMVPPDAHFAGAAEEALALLEDPALASIFAPDALVEVPFAVTLDGTAWEGRMDRLIVADAAIRVIDFKSNRIPPASPAQIPSAILAQMGAYVAALQAIYPGRSIEAAVLWTRNRSLMTLAHDSVMQAFKQASAP